MPKLLEAFQETNPGTEAFSLRLLEMVARAVHCIAVSIDKLATKSHQGNIKAAVFFKPTTKYVMGGFSLVQL